MYNLGCLYGKTGHTQEAVLMLQNSYQMRRRALPANHPDIGDEIALDQ
jgi:hypothetical protein